MSLLLRASRARSAALLCAPRRFVVTVPEKPEPTSKASRFSKKLQMAQMSDPKAQIEMQSMRRPVLASLGGVVDDYMPPVKRRSLLSREGISAYIHDWKMVLRKYVSIFHARKHLKGFNQKEFALEAQSLYMDMTRAIVARDTETLENLTTPQLFVQLQSSVLAGNHNRFFEFVRSVSDPEVLHVAAIPVESKEDLWIQATVKMHTEQRNAVYDARHRLLSGHPDLVKPVVECIVFERHVSLPDSAWRVLSKLRQPEPSTSSSPSPSPAAPTRKAQSAHPSSEAPKQTTGSTPGDAPASPKNNKKKKKKTKASPS